MIASIIDLTTRLNIEASLGQDDFNLVIEGRGVYGLIHDEGDHFKGGLAYLQRLRRTVVYGSYSTPVFAEFLFGLQVFQNACKVFSIFAAEFAHGFAAAGGFGVFFFRSSETCFVYVESLFAGDVAGDFKGQAVGGIQVKGLVTIEDGFVWRESQSR
jgi:hypothetical protein